MHRSGYILALAALLCACIPSQGPAPAPVLRIGTSGDYAPFSLDGSGFDIESYLHHQGQKFVDRFDANCYVSLTRQLNTHDVGRSRGGHEEALGALPQPALVVGIRSDVLYPLHEQVELSSLLPGLIRPPRRR